MTSAENNGTLPSRPTTPTTGSIYNGKLSQGLTEPDSKYSHKGFSRFRDSPSSSIRKSYHQSDTLERSCTPNSLAQYAEGGIYIGPKNKNTTNRIVSCDTLERSPRLKSRCQDRAPSEPLVNMAYEQSSDISETKPPYVVYSTSNNTNSAFTNVNASNESSQSSIGQQQRPAYIQNGRQNSNYAVHQPLSSQQSNYSDHNQPIQQPIMQNQQNNFGQNFVGVPSQRVAVPKESPPHDYETLSRNQEAMRLAQAQMLQQQQQYEQQLMKLQQLQPQVLEKLTVQKEAENLQMHPTNGVNGLTNGYHNGIEQALPNQKLTNHVNPVQHVNHVPPNHETVSNKDNPNVNGVVSQPQPLPRSTVPTETKPQSELTFEISLKNSKSTHTIQPKTLNTEL